MGVVNVTPDSFSDGGLWLDSESAITHGKQLAAEGAQVLDIGGESTRPGAPEVTLDEELSRVIPVIEGLQGTARLSIDTRKPDVARAAVAAGATLINDISASLWEVAAETGAGWIAMHMQGDPQTMQKSPHYDDVVSEVASYLQTQARQAVAAGVKEAWIDPGIGFGKTVDHNLALLRNIDALRATGFPVVIGASRKSMLGTLTTDADFTPPPNDRVDASIAVAVWAIANGAGMIRVHDVQATVRAARVITAIQHAKKEAA